MGANHPPLLTGMMLGQIILKVRMCHPSNEPLETARTIAFNISKIDIRGFCHVLLSRNGAIIPAGFGNVAPAPPLRRGGGEEGWHTRVHMHQSEAARLGLTRGCRRTPQSRQFYQRPFICKRWWDVSERKKCLLIRHTRRFELPFSSCGQFLASGETLASFRRTCSFWLPDQPVESCFDPVS